MLIGIDAHNLEGNRTGVGRYLFNLVKIWSSGQPILNAEFILYFKNEIPNDLPQSKNFKYKLLKVDSTAKFMHWDLPRAAKKDKVDILFCPGYIAPLCYKGKIALALHDIIYEVHPEWFNWPSLADKILLKWVSKKSAKKASVIFAPSEFSRQEVIKYYNAPPQKVLNIPLAVDPSLIGRGEALTEDMVKLKAKFSIKDKFIFYVGSIFSRRHLAEIIEAFSHLAKEKSEFQLFLVGVDYTPGEAVGCLIDKKNKELGRQAILRVDSADQNELKLLYSACAFFIWLSDYEGFGLPPLEAMANGAPVITSKTTSLKEVVLEVGLLIKNNSDVEKIYQAMMRLSSDENLRIELSGKGKEQAEKFSWEKCAKETYEKILYIP